MCFASGRPYRTLRAWSIKIVDMGTVINSPVAETVGAACWLLLMLFFSRLDFNMPVSPGCHV